MNTKCSRLSEQYLAALRKYLKPGSKTSLPPAAGLGRQAVAAGLETLDLARIHTQALTALIPPGGSSMSKEGMFKRARAFFAEAIVPIEKTHRAARKTDAHLNQLDRTLRRRTVESSDSTRHLQRGIVQRRASELALEKSGQHHAKLLEESRRLQKHLRHLTCEIVSAQEDDRRKLSHDLHDEIAQILLGINIRLLALKKAARTNTGSLNKEIASTQRLVKQSVGIINQFAHEFGLHHEK